MNSWFRSLMSQTGYLSGANKFGRVQNNLGSKIVSELQKNNFDNETETEIVVNFSMKVLSRKNYHPSYS